MKKSEKIEKYFEKRPKINEGLLWYENKKGIVTLKVINKGFYNKLCQFLFNKPKISYIHLDRFGSYIWLQLDGKSTIYEIGKKAEKHFGTEITPVYERLIRYFFILKSYRFIEIIA